jgi:hypothetical protein
MKTIKVIAAVVLLLATNAVSYWLGYNAQDGKNYEAACLQADFIRNLMDWDIHSTGPTIGHEIEESWYEWYQDLNYGVYNTKYIKDIKDFDEYHWSY